MQDSQAAISLASDRLEHDAEQWENLQTLYHLAAGAAAAEREPMLQAVGANPSLVRRVLSLLDAESDTEPHPAQPSRDIPPGARIGPYALLRHLGSGGLGSVYLCERVVGGAVQQCALKVLAAYSNEPSFRARFEREQQILATLSHPHITRLLDAGMSDTHQPYLVMEFVDGVDLARFADERRLTIPQRIALFITICDAVAYAHRNLVVHLDLKPSNILVTADGTVKLLDFGTSRLGDLESPLTTITIIATPAYASPEQLCGSAPITTACDVYALGAILYELLSGQRPFPTTSIALAISRAAQEREPASMADAVSTPAAGARSVPPERLRNLLRGDLAGIVAQCMRSRPQDRYSSVEALAADLRSYLEQRPVTARRQTVFYRAGKFARRHRLALGFAAVVSLLLAITGDFAYTRQQQALAQGRRAQQMQTFLSQLIQLTNQTHMGGPAATVPEFLRLGVAVLPDIIKDPADRRAAQLSLGKSMYDSHDFVPALAVLQQAAASARAANDAAVKAEADAFAGFSASNLGQTAEAQQLTERGLALAHARGVGPATRVWVEAFYASIRLTHGFERPRNFGIFEQAAQESRSPEVPEHERLWVLEHLAELDLQTGRVAQASALAAETNALLKREPYALCDRATILELQAHTLVWQTRDAESVPLYQRAVAAATQCAGPESDLALGIQNWLGRALIVSGQRAQAIALLESILPAYRRSAAGIPAISMPLTFLARAYLETGQPAKAEAAAREGLAAQAGRVNPISTRVALCRFYLAQALAAEGRPREALAQAELTDNTYAQVHEMSSIERSFAVQAHAFLLNLLAQSPPVAD